MRRRGWQGFLDWFRPVDRGASLSGTSVHRTGDASEAVADALFAAELGDTELMDFLAADLDPVAADPMFREQLREELWSLVQDGVTARSKDH